MNQIRYTNVCTCNNFYNDCSILALIVLFSLVAHIWSNMFLFSSKELTSSIRYIAYCDPRNGTSSFLLPFVMLHQPLFITETNPLNLNARVGLLARDTTWGTDTSDINGGSFQQCAKTWLTGFDTAYCRSGDVRME